MGADVGLFYYAGHGLQIDGKNFLVPIEANPTKEADVFLQMIDTQVVLSQMEGAGTKLNIVLLDACRNSPFGGRGLRATSGGLAQMQAPEGTLISYATQPGNVATDGANGDSPYTLAVADTISRPGVGLFDAFNQVGVAVKRATGGAQQPWVASSPIEGSFYFAGAPQAAAEPAATPTPVAAATHDGGDGRIGRRDTDDGRDARQAGSDARRAAEPRPTGDFSGDPGRPGADGGVGPRATRVAAAGRGVCDRGMRSPGGSAARSRPARRRCRRRVSRYRSRGGASGLPRGNRRTTEQSPHRLRARTRRLAKAAATTLRRLPCIEKRPRRATPGAMHNIALAYENGKGVDRNLATALDWFRKSANAGDTAAMVRLGFAYKNGEGVAVDYVQALQWFRKAADARRRRRE